MKAIKIDVIKQHVEEIDIEDSLNSMYAELDCNTFTAPYSFANNDVLYVDDEGLLKDWENVKGAFFLKEWNVQPLFGHGLIIGTNEEGESVDVSTNIEKIRNQIVFFKKDEVLKKTFDKLLNTPPKIYSF